MNILESRPSEIELDRIMLSNSNFLFAYALYEFVHQGRGAMVVPFMDVPVVINPPQNYVEAIYATVTTPQISSEEGHWKYVPQAALKELQNLEIDSAVSDYKPLEQFVGVTVRIKGDISIYRAYIIKEE